MKKRLGIFMAFVFCISLLTFVSPVIAGELVETTLAWDANTETNLAGYKAKVSDVSGSGYVQFGENIPAGTEEITYQYNGDSDVAVKKFFVVTAYNTDDPPLESGVSNEVYWIYNFAPSELTATLEGDDITFAWKQPSVDWVSQWKLYQTETSGENYQELAVIEYTGQAGPQFTTTETMSVPSGEKKTFYFVMVAFDEAVDPTGTVAFSTNSNEVSVTIDKTAPKPVYNVIIKIKAE